MTIKTTFTTTITRAEGMNATGIRVPADAISALGSSKKPAVIVRIKGHEYRSTVAVYGDAFMIALNQENRAAAKVQAGDLVEITLELDTEPRTVTVPDVLAEALSMAHIRETFDGLSYSKRKEYVRQIESAKAEETRNRRITKIISDLSKNEG